MRQKSGEYLQKITSIEIIKVIEDKYKNRYRVVMIANYDGDEQISNQARQ